MASEFIYTNPEAAKQAIAKLQLQAALAENQSRENIAREQTQQQRYATQSQISEREKDRAVSREDIAARYGYNSRATTDKDARERTNVQYSTIEDKILHNQADPPTKGELEAMFSSAPDLTKDLIIKLRSLRDDAYKAAKQNASDGEQSARNYTARLAEFAKSKFPEQVSKAKESLLNRISGDKNLIYDAATGTVMSRWKQPREDSAPSKAGMGADYKPGGVFPSAAEMQRAGTPTASSGIPTIADVYKARVSGVPAGTSSAISPAQDYGGASMPPTTSTITTTAPVAMEPSATMPPSQAEILALFDRFHSAVPDGSVVQERYQQGGGRTGYRNVVPDPNAALSGFSSNINQSLPRQRPSSAAMLGPILSQSNDYLGRTTPRVYDIAPPAAAIPTPTFASPTPVFQGPRPIVSMDLPQFQSPAGNMDALMNIARHPDFGTLPPAHQQWILDEIGNSAPRAYDMQTIRPEFRPPLDYYAPQ